MKVEGHTATLTIPIWRKFELAEADKRLTIKLFDELDGRDLPMGIAVTSIAAILNSPNLTWSERLKLDDFPIGNVSVKLDINTSQMTNISFGFRWENVNNLKKGVMGVGKKRTTVQFRIIRPKFEDGKYSQPEEVLWSSEKVKKKESSDWEFDDLGGDFQLKTLCEGNLDRMIKFQILNKKGKEINAVELPVRDLAKAER